LDARAGLIPRRAGCSPVGRFEARPWMECAVEHDGMNGAAGPAADLATIDDRALVDTCLAGRREAFDELVVRHRRAVYRLCYRFVGNHEDATDLAQETFLRAYRALRTFKGESAFGTWLHRIAVNLSLNAVASHARRAETNEERAAPVATDPNAMSRLLSGERAGQVRAAIARLPAKQRATLVLRVYQELPHQEIAELLGSSVGAVKANFFHALANLKRLLGGDLR
jgi:RNA polymerase sigma-70 factor (ECF subfamily)